MKNRTFDVVFREHFPIGVQGTKRANLSILDPDFNKLDQIIFSNRKPDSNLAPPLSVNYMALLSHPACYSCALAT